MVLNLPCAAILYCSPGAKFSNPEVMLGMVPGWMGIERVLNQVGPVVGRQMLMLGKRLTAQGTSGGEFN